jgi:organic hydroperoxide reductase OsmC/OhrA
MRRSSIAALAGADIARPITDRSRPTGAAYGGNGSARTETFRRYGPAMMTHTYQAQVAWQGSTGAGYRAYSRAHAGVAPPSAEIPMSADPHFRGDAEQVNPEQLLVMAASSCQLLSFLAVAARAGVEVIQYQDSAEGVMPGAGSPMRIERIDLRPIIHVAPGTDHDQVRALVEQAHQGCYIANSLTTAVTLSPTVVDA